ncbi:replication protein [Campylobacter upsaliensis]
MAENAKNDKARYWGFLVYPESVAQDWEEVLSVKYGFEWVKSPLHDKDINADNTPKKPHYHCLIYFNGKKSYNQIKTIMSEIGATAPQIIHNAKGNVRYMLHLDNPEKAQYKISDLKAFNGFDIEKYIFSEKELNEKRLNALNDIYDFIEQQGLTEFHQINTYARKNEPYWFELINTNSAYAINLHLKSIRHSKT